MLRFANAEVAAENQQMFLHFPMYTDLSIGCALIYRQRESKEEVRLLLLGYVQNGKPIFLTG